MFTTFGKGRASSFLDDVELSLGVCVEAEGAIRRTY